MSLRFFLILFLLSTIGFVLDSCNNSTTKPTIAIVNKDSMRIDGAPVKNAGGWGYQIMVDNKMFINQTNIPAIQGDKSFATAEDAAKVASLVISKIKNHQKPVILIEDLNALGISNR